MYLPELFAVTDREELDAVLAGLRLGCLVTRDGGGFFGTHLPVMFDSPRRVLAGLGASEREGDRAAAQAMKS